MTNCTVCSRAFDVSPRELDACRKFEVEPPDMCFTCDHMRRLLFRNGRHLYKRKCNFSGQQIISIYAPEKPYKVYKSEFWYGDKWDAASFGREIDWNRPFFEQLKELQLEVPRLALTNIKAENSDYCNMTEGNRNCYLIFGGDFNEDCMYGTFGMHNKSVMDCDNSNDSERCYFMSDSFNCYGCRFTFDSKNCSDCAFVSDCTGCRDCVLCTNLTQKQYCIENTQYTKDEYEKRKAEFLNGSYAQRKRNLARQAELRAGRVVRPTHMLSSQDCSGDYIVNSKNCHDCYDVWDCEDMQSVVLASHMKDGYRSDCVGHKSELCFNMQSTVNVYDCRCSFSVFDSQSVRYSDFILNSKHLFGCMGMRRKEYCILNRQYTKEEYGNLTKKLEEHMRNTGEWDRFLPPELSCFGFNESTANDFFPLAKEEAERLGFEWFDAPEETIQAERTIPASQLPDDIAQIPDDILNWAVTCEKTGKPFRIIKQELDFYRRENLPVPRLHPDARHAERFAMRTPKTLWKRTCAQCGKDIETVYGPDRSETVYCESCYLATVY